MFKKYLSGLVLLLSFILLTGCPKKDNDNQVYQLKQANNALMGPLKNATVKIYKAEDLANPIETVKTGEIGDFTLKLNNIDDDRVLLVIISGGEDIDSNDDGVIDNVYTKNEGVIHGFATAKDLKDGKVNITLLSEIVYFYTNYLFNRTSNKDMQKIISIVTSKLFKDQTLSQDEYLNKLYSFNPIKKEDRNLLSFDYRKLIEGDSLSSLIYQNSPEIGTKIEILFNKILTPNDVRLLNLRDSVLVHLTPPMYANIISTGSNIFFNYDNNQSLLSEYISKDSNITFTIIPNQGYKVIKWYGCDSLSNDLTKCSINNIIEDKIITPIVVPSEIVINSDIDIYDITGSIINIDNDIYNIATTNNNFIMQKKLSEVDIDSIIVSKTEPVFFRKVTEVIKIDDTHYQFRTELIPIEEIITKGYISSSLGTAAPSGTQIPISTTAKLITSDGREFDMQKNKDGSYSIDLEKIYKTTIFINGIGISENKTFFKEDNFKVEGKYSIKPYIEFDMSWESFNGLTMLYIKPGFQVKPELSLEIFGKWSGYKEKEIDKILISQVFMAGPIPIQITEDIRILVGVEGNIKTSYRMGLSFIGDIGFPFRWNKSSGLDDMKLDFKPSIDLNIGEIKAEGLMGVYINLMPTINVYGLGIGLANKFGGYGKVSASAGLDLKYKCNTITDKCDGNIKGIEATAETYLQYKPEFRLVFPDEIKDIKMAKEITKDFNKNKPNLPNMTFSIKKWQVALDNTPDKLPGRLEIQGLNYEENVKVGDSLIKTFEYELSNSGDKDIDWSVAMFSSSEIFKSIKLSKTNGSLKAGESEIITLSLDIDEIKNIGTKIGFLKFFSSSENNILSIGKLELAKEYLYKIIAYQELSKVTGAKVMFEDNLETTKLKFQFDESSDDVDGYIIYKADYNSSIEECYNNYGEFALLQGKDNTKYEVTIDYLLQSKDLFKKVELNKSYCFNIIAFKDFNNIKSTSNFMDEPLIVKIEDKSDKPTLTFPALELINKEICYLKGECEFKIGIPSRDIYPFSSMTIDLINISGVILGPPPGVEVEEKKSFSVKILQSGNYTAKLISYNEEGEIIDNITLDFEVNLEEER